MANNHQMSASRGVRNQFHQNFQKLVKYFQKYLTKNKLTLTAKASPPPSQSLHVRIGVSMLQKRCCSKYLLITDFTWKLEFTWNYALDRMSLVTDAGCANWQNKLINKAIFQNTECRYLSLAGAEEITLTLVSCPITYRLHAWRLGYNHFLKKKE